MFIAKKRQRVLDTLIALRDFIWIEDLYLLLRSKGEVVSSRTVYDTVWELDRVGLISCRIEGRKTLIKFQFNKNLHFITN